MSVIYNDMMNLSHSDVTHSLPSKCLYTPTEVEAIYFYDLMEIHACIAFNLAV